MTKFLFHYNLITLVLKNNEMEKKGDINFLSEQSNLKQIGKQLLKIIKRVSNGVENILYYFIDV
ncbi:MAG: hypothetical protein LBQ24_03705 [Candidatus Peribacteria bacterium]|nr:hypothetical protein [Candidatus Peribacteria bacterium]